MFEKRVTDKANEVIMDLLKKIQFSVNTGADMDYVDTFTMAVQRLTWLAETKQETNLEEK